MFEAAKVISLMVYHHSIPPIPFHAYQSLERARVIPTHPQDSSAYEDDHQPSPSTNHRRRRLSETPSHDDGSASSSYGSSSGSDDDFSQDEGRQRTKKSVNSRKNNNDEDDDDHSDHDESDDSFTEVNGKGHPRKGGKVPRTRRDEFKNLDADLYDLRRSERSSARKATHHDDDDDDEDEEDEAQTDDDESEFNDDEESDSATPEEESDDSDSDFSYGSRKRKARGSKKKNSKPPAKRNNNGDNEYSSRYSSRGGQVNYNEDDNDWGISSSDDDDKLPAYHVQAAQEEEGEVIESIHDFRRMEGAEEDEQDEPRHNLEYLVKWKGKSHLHDTWETYSDLKQYKGAKKVDSYIQRFVYPEIQLKSDPNTMREEIEQSDVNREMMRDELKDYRTVERVIASRTNEKGETEYFCKWLRLPYSAATWEAADLIAENHQTEIDAFLDRESSQKVPYKTAIYPKGQRPPFKRMLTQPEYLAGGQLRDYQLTGLNWMSRLWSCDENGILADEMGLGKTVQSISIISFLFHTHNLYGPYLVVVPLSTIGSWQREFERWAPDLNVIIYIGDAASRQTIRDYEFYQKGSTTKIRFNVLLTTFELVRMDRAELDKIKWTYLAIDEAHRLKNKQSQLHETLKDFHTTNRLLITGTPLQNSVKELIALCNFLMPDKFTDDDFEIEMGDAEQEKKIRDLHESLKPYMLRRLKKDVEKSLPKKTERILRVELSALQTHYYKNILTKNFAALNKGVSGQGQLSLLNVAMELKKASNHPFLFPNAEIVSERREDQLRGIIMNSGKMVLLDKLLTKLKKDGHRVLIFSQMVRMLDIMTDYLTLRGFAFQRLDGSVGSEARKRSIEHFNAPNSIDFVFLLSTRAGGLGINLETADTVIIFDSDWNPQNDLQAMARAHRIGQKNTVNVYRFVSKDTIEEDIIERAKRKMVLEYCIIKQMDTSGLEILQQKKAAETSTGFSKEELSAILKFGAQNMFQQTDNNNNKKLDEMDLDEILARAEDHDTTDAVNMAGGEEFLSQFQYADFGAGDMSWEEIIPLEERERFEAEERAKLEEQLYTPRNRSRVSYAEGRNTSASPEPEEEGRRKKRKVSSNSGGGSSGSRRKRGAGVDPSEFNTKDLRALARGMLKFGILADRYQDVVAEAELEDKDEEVIKKESNDLIHACEDALGVPHDSYLDELFDDDDLPYARKNAKAVLFTYKELEKMNAGQMILRLKDLRAMNKRLKDTDLSKFRINARLKPVMNWTCSWGQKEDAMLIVGIFKHGFGAWDKIQEDPDLGLQKKFFLSDAGDVKKIPKALHLVRRGEYLLKVLRESERDKLLRKSSSAAAAATSGSSSKKNRDNSSRSSKPSSPATHKSSSGGHKSHGSRRTTSRHASDSEDASSVGPQENTMVSSKELLRAVRTDLRTIRDSAKNSVDPQVIGECLNRIGREIERVIEGKSSTISASGSSSGTRRRSERERERLSKQLWTFAGKMFPSPIHYEDLRKGYEELKNAQAQAAGGDKAASSPSSSAAAGGEGEHGKGPSSSSKRDGSRERGESNGHHRSRSSRGDDGGRHGHGHHHSHHRSSGDRDWDRDRERDREHGRDRGRDRDRERERGRGERDRGERQHDRERADHRHRRSSHDAPNGGSVENNSSSLGTKRRGSSPRRSISEDDFERKDTKDKERSSRQRSRSDGEEEDEDGERPAKRRNTGGDESGNAAAAMTVARENSNIIDSPAASLSSPASSSSVMTANGAIGPNDAGAASSTAAATASGKDNVARHGEDEEHGRSRSKERSGDLNKRRRDRSYERRDRSRSRDRSRDRSHERNARDGSGRSGRSGRDRERDRERERDRDRDRDRDRERDRERDRDRDRRDRDRDRSRDRERERDRDRERRRDRSRERDRDGRRGRDRSRERSRERSRSQSRSRDRRYR
ncbi:hypothetical protein BGW42_001565 [Actinomortierella wolfii]|nr:hypothetical protein BGW42_001565 [Actinomortierella wolfii]